MSTALQFPNETTEQHPQQANRTMRVFTDQHGRKWQAIIEVKTGRPVSPPWPRFKAPVYPETAFFRYGRGDQEGEIFIDYDAWLEQLDNAWRNYHQRLHDVAKAEYKDQRPEDMIANPTDQLISAWGDPPVHRDIPRAMRAKNKWILGQVDISLKPAWAEAILPTPKETEKELEQFEFPDVEVAPADEELPISAYPIHKGGGKWILSDKSVIGPCNKEKAQDAQKAILEFANAGG